MDDCLLIHEIKKNGRCYVVTFMTPYRNDTYEDPFGTFSIKLLGHNQDTTIANIEITARFLGICHEQFHNGLVSMILTDSFQRE